MIDVIDGAISEVKDRARVVTLAVADAALVGRAVGDTIHLLAELIENGASFSPPDACVRVSGELVPNGFAIEIEDRGAGMSAEAIAETNQRLAEPPEADPTTSTRLGLFVVAQLAARHDIRVRLRPTPYGGTTAVVLVPPELVAVTPDDAPAEGAPAARVEVRPVFDVGPTDVRELGANAPAARAEIGRRSTPAPPARADSAGARCPGRRNRPNDPRPPPRCPARDSRGGSGRRAWRRNCVNRRNRPQIQRSSVPPTRPARCWPRSRPARRAAAGSRPIQATLRRRPRHPCPTMSATVKQSRTLAEASSGTGGHR